MTSPIPSYLLKLHPWKKRYTKRAWNPVLRRTRIGSKQKQGNGKSTTKKVTEKEEILWNKGKKEKKKIKIGEYKETERKTIELKQGNNKLTFWCWNASGKTIYKAAIYSEIVVTMHYIYSHDKENASVKSRSVNDTAFSSGMHFHRF